MFSSQIIAALAVGGALGILVPIAAIVVFKLKNREVRLRTAFIGMGTFFVFALVLEQLLHLAVSSAIGTGGIGFGIYAALAAGVFEETGRLVAYKTLMKREGTLKNAVFMGIGHGGFEAAATMGFSMITYLVIALTANGYGGAEAFLEATKNNGSELTRENMKTTLETLGQVGFANVFMSLYERIVAMTFHVCMSVWVYKAVTHKMPLYPAAIAAHALLDVPAVLYQLGFVTNIAAVYVIMTVYVAAVVLATVKLTKKFPDKAR